MAAVANSADQAVELLQKFTLEPKPKSMEIPEPTKKATGNQYGSVDNGNAQIPSYERSLTPVLPEFMDPAMCYLPNGYPSTTFYYGGYEGTGNFEWEDFSRYMSPDGVDLTSGVYGDNGSLVYHHGYGYAPYAPYSPAGSPVPTMGNDGQLYGPQHYQYPPYFQPLTPTSGPFTPTPAVHTQGEISTSVAADQKPLSLDTSNGNSNVVSNGVGAKGRTTTSAYQDPKFGFDGARSPVPWLDALIFSDGPKTFGSSAEIFHYFHKFLNVWPHNLNVNKYEHTMLLESLKNGHAESEKRLAQGFVLFKFANTLATIAGAISSSGRMTLLMISASGSTWIT